MKKQAWVTWGIIAVIIIVAAFILFNRSGQNVQTELAKCIGENSELYIQLGCHACQIQEDMFGDSYENLNVIDCFYDQQECIDRGIKATPTWIIKNQTYVGVQDISTLKELTGC